ncbi:MAG: hypothetical protein JO371_03310 [Paraburkholderia sp.]|nr:hypothetical protein [Paraburkholderia sp.]MBV8626886.1 hypothetical protein [Paraburkholderia sp.]
MENVKIRKANVGIQIGNCIEKTDAMEKKFVLSACFLIEHSEAPEQPHSPSAIDRRRRFTFVAKRTQAMAAHVHLDLQTGAFT